MGCEKSCRSCSHGMRMVVNKDILCKIRGAVSPEYLCTRYKAIEDSDPQVYKRFNCIECENFLIKIDKNSPKTGIGICSLFSVRYFDGKSRNACSKFEHRRELNTG